MRTVEVLGDIWSTWSFIKYEAVKWYWMRRDHQTGWMVPCSLLPVYAKKYVKWKQEGEVCVDVRLLVFLDWRAVSWRWRGRSRNVYQSLPAGEDFSSVFTCFPVLRCVCVFVRNGVVWRIHFIFFLFFCYCFYSVYHTVPLQSFSLKFCTFLGRIGMQGISMAYCYRCSLVCLLDTTMSHTETDKLIKMPFGLC